MMGIAEEIVTRMTYCLAHKGTQTDAAAIYSEALVCSAVIDWGTLNRAIRDRWSMSGLMRVKQMAWRAARKTKEVRP
jgi:hypothetical protein